MRFYLDENLSPDLAAIARRIGVDITDWRECGQIQSNDEEHLRYAAQSGRCVVTTDVDFIGWTQRFRERGEAHAGLLMIPWQIRKRDFAAFARGLARFAEDHPEGLAPYEVQWLAEASWRTT
jgi:hypothetical protein